MVALYRLTDDRCNFWPHFVIRPPNVPLYSLTGEKYNLWPHFVIGPSNGPLYNLTCEKYNLVGKKLTRSLQPLFLHGLPYL